MRTRPDEVKTKSTVGAVKVGTAGWSIASRYLGTLPRGGSHLERYARAFPIVEITTSFYRHHQPDTYARWARSVGDDFRFSVKTPQALTHEGALASARSDVLGRFLDEVAGLGGKLRALLVQLPPSLEFESRATRRFFTGLRKRAPAAVAIACEPRHPSWSSDAANTLLMDLGISRVAADPPRWNDDASIGGDATMAYFRMHGSPRIYYSDYQALQLRQLSVTLNAVAQTSAEVWCIFDNTAHGHAIGNALAVQNNATG